MPDLLCMFICKQNWWEGGGCVPETSQKQSGRHLPIVEAGYPQQYCYLFSLFLGEKKNERKKDCLFQRVSELILQKRTLKKGGKKRILCKSSGGFQNFPFLPGIDMIFPFALSSPLWHSWYISLSIITNFKAPPPWHFCKPSRLKYKCWFQLPYFLEFGAGCGLRNAEELPGTFINF